MVSGAREVVVRGAVAVLLTPPVLVTLAPVDDATDGYSVVSSPSTDTFGPRRAVMPRLAEADAAGAVALGGGEVSSISPSS